MMKHELIVAFSLGMTLAIPVQADNPLQPQDRVPGMAWGRVMVAERRGRKDSGWSSGPS
jgi:hypothetical protein